MARKGQPKVKTGCATCKVRKVKCDETRPTCLRCSKTGRKCEGYVSPPPGSYSWEELLLVRSPRPPPGPIVEHRELRSLGFFLEVAAPALSGLLDPSFWTRLVAQVAHHEEAAKHAVVAISSLYENFEDNFRCQEEDAFAIAHYNRAIKGIVESRGLSVDAVLVICVLFVCVEFLRGDSLTAITHLRHGLLLAQGARLEPEVLAMFRHLQIFPLFFGATLSTLQEHDPEAMPTLIESISEARDLLDRLSVRSVRLVKAGDPYRLGLESSPVPSAVQEQQDLLEDLTDWLKRVTGLDRGVSEGPQDALAYLMLQMRWTVAKVWTSVCLTQGEGIFDDYVADFEAIVAMATEALAIRQSYIKTRPKFIIDMGFAPPLHFVVVKCRHLHLRVAALTLMRGLSATRETLWDAPTMQATGLRIIEIEHGIKLTRDTLGNWRTRRHGAHYPVPPEERRIRDSWRVSESDFQAPGGAKSAPGMDVCFLLSAPGKGMRTKREWISSEETM